MRGGVARNTVWGVAWQAIRIAFQSTWIFLLARFLDVTDFGLLIGLVAFGTAIGLISGLGFGQVMLRRVSADPRLFTEYWTKSLIVTAVSSAPLALLFVGIPVFVEHHASDELILSAIAVSEIICTPLLALSTLAFQCRERLGWGLASPAFAAFTRLSAACVYLSATPNPTVYGYAPFHLSAAIFSTLVTITITQLFFPQFSWSAIRWRLRDFKDGIRFACLGFTGAGTTELDKPLALRCGGSEVAAIYSVAARLVSILMVPVSTLVMAIQPRLFKNHERNRPLAARAVTATLIYGLAGILLLQFCASLLPTLLGANYLNAVTPARYLALLIPLYGLRLLATTQLTATERLNARIMIEGTGIALLVVLSFTLIPRFGVNGSVVAALAAEFTVTALAWGAIKSYRSPSTPIKHA